MESLPVGRPRNVPVQDDPELQSLARELLNHIPPSYTPLQRAWLAHFTKPVAANPLLDPAAPLEGLDILLPRQHPPPPEPAPRFSLRPAAPIGSSMKPPAHAALLYTNRFPEVGDMLVVRAKQPDPFWIAKVLTVQNRWSLIVQWYSEDQNHSWSPLNHQDKISASSVILSGYQLQPDGRFYPLFEQLLRDVLAKEASPTEVD